MTQQTTAERIERILGVHYDWTGRVIEAGVDTAAEKIAAEIDTLTRERDEARAQAIEANTNAAYAQTHEESLRIHKASLIKKLDATEKQLAEARAEVERLRPAAEAWEAREAFMNQRLPGDEIEGEDVDAWNLESHRLNVLLNAANDRARAAKGTP